MGQTQKMVTIKLRIHKTDFIKLKISDHNNIKKIYRKVTDWVKILSIHICGKGLVLIIYKELLQTRKR